MSEPEADGGTPQPTDEQSYLLARKITAALDGRGQTWLSKNAVDPLTGDRPISVTTASDLMNAPRLGFVAPHRQRAVANALGWTHADFYVANAESCRLDPPPAGEFAATLPGWVDRLPLAVKMVLRDQIRLFGQAHGLTD